MKRAPRESSEAGMELSNRAFAQQAGGPGFNLQHPISWEWWYVL